MRIANPIENRNRTKFKGAENLRRTFKKDILRCTRGPIARFILGLLGENISEKPNLRMGRKTNATKVSALQPYMVKRKGPLRIFASYKGKKYSAIVGKNGWIRYKGRKYSSPSAVAEGITKGHTDGRTFWKYKDPKTKELVPLDLLREKSGR